MLIEKHIHTLLCKFRWVILLSLLVSFLSPLNLISSTSCRFSRISPLDWKVLHGQWTLISSPRLDSVRKWIKKKHPYQSIFLKANNDSAISIFPPLIKFVKTGGPELLFPPDYKRLEGETELYICKSYQILTSSSSILNFLSCSGLLIWNYLNLQQKQVVYNVLWWSLGADKGWPVDRLDWPTNFWQES